MTLTLCASAVCAGPALEQKEAPFPNTLRARIKALTRIETLNARILCASCTVTGALEKWCANDMPASEPLVHARRIPGAAKPVSAEQRKRLQIGPEEEVIYRHVELSCRGRVLVEADNWYVPSRVGADINRVLTATDTPFGRAVERLKPKRENLSVEFFWKPLPGGWEKEPSPADRPGEELVIPWQLFQHRAVIYDGEHVPFSEVQEIFTREVLAFGPP